ncbi:MAG: 2-amino-4-hydroxy-6-hydroxymethyldihydropteridine diphosphokinase [Bacteroidales bacterium]|nr:2-amino-4-hydroxy-6-hydroxymethyldihydropteridine diphosphokinase [Bacteroidales bacterium]
MSKVFLSLGSNKNDRHKSIKAAIKKINKKLGDIIQTSDVFETESWSYHDNNYLNAVIEIETEFIPKDLLKELKRIEKELGRKNKTVTFKGKPKYLSRTIDIDILFYDDKVISTKELTIPHTKLHLRNFVLKPMMQIAPDFIHPVFQKNINCIYTMCEDKSMVTLFKE